MPNFDALSDHHGLTGGSGGAGGSGNVIGGASGEAGQLAANGGVGDSNGGNGEVGGMADSAGVGGMSGTEGTEEAGAGGAAPTEPPCGGCARASVPLQMANTGQALVIGYATPIDLTGVTITVRVRAPGAKGGVLQIFAQDDKFAADYSFGKSLMQYRELTDVSYKIPSGIAGYNTASIKQVVVSVFAGDGPSDCALAPKYCPWTQPTLLDIDSITLTGGPPDTPGPYTFDTTTDPFVLTSYQPVPGSTLFWIP